MIMTKRMKGLNFTVPGLFDKVLDGTKDITIRGSFIPKYLRNEIILLKEKIVTEDKDGKKTSEIKRTVKARVAFVKPIQLKSITDKIAIREGFENAAESKKWLMQTYHLKDERHWLFATAWKLLGEANKQPNIEEFITQEKDE